MDNLVIFSTNQNCVKQKVTSFDIPAKMPKCTGSHCICSWHWLANRGTANFYQTGFNCNITGTDPEATAIAPPSDPVFCKDDPSTCTKGAKRPIYAYNYPSNVPWIGNDDRAGSSPFSLSHTRFLSASLLRCFRGKLTFCDSLNQVTTLLGVSPTTVLKTISSSLLVKPSTLLPSQ
jgi:hypothetical protein